MKSRITPLTIAGGGIGGLTTALALARRGIPSRLLERGGFGEATGAGIQLGANAVRRLQTLGLREAIEAEATRPEALHIFDAHSGKALKTIPFGHGYESRYGAPYLALRRADLAKALVDACRAAGQIALQDQFCLTSVMEQRDHVLLQGPSEEQTLTLIGADGLWSIVRQAVAPSASLHFTGHSAARSALPTDRLPAPFGEPVVTLWLGRGAHLVTYPVARGEALNVVLASEDGTPHEGWNVEASGEEIAAAVRHWHDAPRSLLESASGWRRWSLYKLRGLRRWTTRRIALLGDAAHPVLPFLAQGAALSIEDAVTLADALSGSPDDPATAFSQYEAERCLRAARVMRQSARLGRIYHLGGPFAAARNLAIARQSPDRALRQFDWLYGA